MIIESRAAISSSRSRPTRCKANVDSDALVASVTTSGERVGRNPWAAATSWLMGKALEPALELVRGTESQLAHLGECLDPGCSSGAFGHDKDPDRPRPSRLCLLAFPWARPNRTARAGLNGVERIGLAAVSSGLAVLTVHFDDRDPARARMTRDAGAVGTRALDADLGDRAEVTQPGQQGRVAVGLRTKRPGNAEQHTTSSNTAATWTSPWVSIPPVTVRAASTMVMPSLPSLTV